jgi:hypothetical protein
MGPMMIDDFLAPSQSAKKIEKRALDWRHALGVPDQWAPDIVELIEVKLPKVFPTGLHPVPKTPS